MALLARDVANNPNRYDGKLVSVVGRVTAIRYGYNGDNEIELEGGLDCHMSYYDDCKSVKRGQKVVIAGKVCVRCGNAEVENGSVVKKFPFRG